MNVSGIAGILGFWGLVILAVLLGGSPGIFVNIPSAVIVFGVTFGVGLMAFGSKDLLSSLLALRGLVFNAPDSAFQQRHVDVLKGLIPSAYASGVLGTLIGAVQMLATLDDPAMLGAGMAVAILTVLYGVLLAEGILRPGARYIEQRSMA